MNEHFALSLYNLQHGRWWTLFTMTFSHTDSAHLLINMVTFLAIAPSMLALTGATSFFGLYLGASLATGFASVASRWYLLPPEQLARFDAIGASGSVYALVTAFTCVHPTATFLLFVVLPTPAWAVVGGIFAYDAYRAAMTPLIRVDAAGHVGGILTGLLFWRFKLKKFRL